MRSPHTYSNPKFIKAAVDHERAVEMSEAQLAQRTFENVIRPQLMANNTRAVNPISQWSDS
jgi:hypothetical protein